MSNKKGQGSLEFLMTYGWAMLVIIIIFIVAWQWGLFDIGGNVKPGSFGFWGVIPQDFTLRSNTEFYVSLLNNVGANITIIEVNASIPTGEAECTDTLNNPIDDATPVYVDLGDAVTIKCILDKQDHGSRYETFLKIRYNETRTKEHEYYSSGRVWGSVEIAP